MAAPLRIDHEWNALRRDIRHQAVREDHTFAVGMMGPAEFKVRLQAGIRFKAKESRARWIICAEQTFAVIQANIHGELRLEMGDEFPPKDQVGGHFPAQRFVDDFFDGARIGRINVDPIVATVEFGSRRAGRAVAQKSERNEISLFEGLLDLMIEPWGHL
ncbi:MAG: hypothetical protein QM813_23915 [Verrucomicrobiota bacterium]